MINSNIEKVIDCAKAIGIYSNIKWDNANIKESLLKTFKDSWSSNILISNLLSNITESHDILKDIINFLPQLKDDINFISYLVKCDSNFINLFPTYTNNKTVKLSILANFPEKIADDISWHKVCKIKDCVAYNPLVYRYLPFSFKSNSAIIKTALKNTVLYKKNDEDLKYGVFFDLSQEQQDNKANILLALKSYPSIYHLLPLTKKNDLDITIAACKSIFYDIDGCYYSKSVYVIPYLADNFFTDVKNIIWVLSAFEDNIENIKQNIDVTMSCFNTFINKACSFNESFNKFSRTNNLQAYFNELLEKHKHKIYTDNLNPTGVEQDAIDFFSINLKGINKNFSNFMLYQKLDNKLPLCKDIKKTTKI